MLNKKYQTQSTNIQSYNYTDIAEGTGVINFKLFTTTDSVGNDYILGTQTLYSSLIDTAVSCTASYENFTKVGDLDFDLTPFNTPKDIKGTAVFQFSHLAKSAGSANTSLDGYTIVRVRKWNGTTETEIGSAQSPTLSPTVSGDEKSGIVCMEATLTNTHFAAGEILRVTVEMWVKATDVGTNSGVYYVGHDPVNRDSTSADGIKPSVDPLIQTFNVYIPFRLDI